jgi:hypothetical protein
LEKESKLTNKEMSECLDTLAIMENFRFNEDNKLNNNEIQLANEFKIEIQNLIDQINKLDIDHKLKLEESISKKEAIKTKICTLVGQEKGLQLYDADFNPKISQHLKQKREILTRKQRIYENEQYPTSNSFCGSSTISDDDNEKSIYVDTSFHATSNYDSGNNSSSSNGMSPINDFGLQQLCINSNQNKYLKFETFSCKALGFSLSINESFLMGRKTWDEHYEYAIELKINDEAWKVFRRFNKIRQLHEKMSKIYHSLNRLVFPTRHFPNLIDRQMQLEHYLRCFIEILINDPSTSIYVNFNNDNNNNNALSNSSSLLQSNLLSNSTSLNSIVYSSNSSINHEPAVAVRLTKVKLCSFCSFFEETPNDKDFLNKINPTNKPSSLKMFSYNRLLN